MTVHTRLTPCRSMWGRADIFERELSLTNSHPAVFVDGALYDFSGKVILRGAYCRGVPEMQIISGWGNRAQGMFAPIDLSSINECCDERCYWVGPLIPHFGHFLLAAVGRLWALEEMDSSVKLLHSGSMDIPALFHGQSYMKELFHACGRQENDFITLDSPTMITDVFVPAPAFEENHYALNSFSSFCSHLGDLILRPKSFTETRSDPIYIFKSPKKYGVSSIVNEDDLAQHLEARGVRIFYPEEHTLADQIIAWKATTAAIGFLGSGMHTALFCEDKEIIGLSYGPQVSSNQVMIDKIGGHRSTYSYIPNGVETDHSGTDPRFHYTVKLANPQGFAEGVLRRLDVITDGVRSRRRRDIVLASCNQAVLTDGPLGEDLVLSLAISRVALRNDSVTENESQNVAEQTPSEVVANPSSFWGATADAPIDLHEIRVFGATWPEAGREIEVSLLDASGNEVWVARLQMDGTSRHPTRWVPEDTAVIYGVIIRTRDPTLLNVDRIEIIGEWAYDMAPAVPAMQERSRSLGLFDLD